MKIKFFEKFVLNEIKEFPSLSTEDKKKYITLYGHYHFSQWLALLTVHPRSGFVMAIIGACLCIAIIVMVLSSNQIIVDRMIFCTTFPLLIMLLLGIHHSDKVLKMEENQQKKWFEKTTAKIQNLLFKDLRFFSIRKRLHIKQVDKKFYKHFNVGECFKECYRATFKLAYLLNDPEVKLVWLAATAFYTEPIYRYGHAVLEKNGIILDTNTRKSYNKTEYLNAQNAEIFKEFVLEEYSKVKTPWDLAWDEFGEWCKVRNVKRCN